jgi:hypothetical protein
LAIGGWVIVSSVTKVIPGSGAKVSYSGNLNYGCFLEYCKRRLGNDIILRELRLIMASREGGSFTR